MLLKTIHQWDIANQEDLTTFMQESEAIHRDAARALYRSEQDPDCWQQRREEEMLTRITDNSQRRSRRRRGEQPGTKAEKKSRPAHKKENARTSEKSLMQERETAIPEGKTIADHYPSREEFLERLGGHLKDRKNARSDGYSIVVQATVEHRYDRAVRVEFVEAEGPRVADLTDPNGGRILEALCMDEVEESYLVEDPDGSTRRSANRYEGEPTLETRTIEILGLQDLEGKDKRIRQWLMAGYDRVKPEEYEMIEDRYRETQRERLAKQIQDKEAKLG